VSTLRVNNISDFSGGSSNLNIPGTAKAWVNFNGTGTVAIRASLNVSSITDNGTGDYTVNFTTAMVDANYAVVALCQGGNGNTAQYDGTSTTSATGVLTRVGTTSTDSSDVMVAIFR
jgi:hypothetical protein